MTDFNIDVDKIAEGMKSEKKQLEEMGGEAKSVHDMAEFFSSRATSFNQEYYVELINKFVKKARREDKETAKKGTTLAYASVCQILHNGFDEVQREMLIEPKIYKPSKFDFEIAQEDSMKALKSASRALLKILNAAIDRIKKKKKNPDTLALKNTVEHIYINWIQSIASISSSREFLDECLDGFINFGINDETNEDSNGANEGEAQEPKGEGDGETTKATFEVPRGELIQPGAGE